MSAPIRHSDSNPAWRIDRLSSVVFLAASMALGAFANAADINARRDIDARYKSERAACESQQSGQDRAACLREAAAARDEAMRGQLDDARASYDQNALARCAALPAAERDLCKRRTRGEGVTKGSVAEGGIYREYREITLPAATPQNQSDKQKSQK